MSAPRRWRQRNPGAPLWQLLWWEVICQPASWLVMFLLYRIRWWGVNNIPRTGPVLLVCNHQSYLDLVTLGIGIHHRHFHSMARSTLFRHPLFAWHIRSLNAFPVEQGKGDVKSVRTAIDRLKQGHLVLVFPEGSRTPHGRLQPFSPGVLLLIKRAKPTIVPMAVDGVFDAWPIGRSRPIPGGRVGAIYGEPIAADDLLAMDNADAIALLERRVEALRLDVRQKLRLTSNGRHPADITADIATV